MFWTWRNGNTTLLTYPIPQDQYVAFNWYGWLTLYNLALHHFRNDSPIQSLKAHKCTSQRWVKTMIFSSKMSLTATLSKSATNSTVIFTIFLRKFSSRLPNVAAKSFSALYVLKNRGPQQMLILAPFQKRKVTTNQVPCNSTNFRVHTKQRLEHSVWISFAPHYWGTINYIPTNPGKQISASNLSFGSY